MLCSQDKCSAESRCKDSRTAQERAGWDGRSAAARAPLAAVVARHAIV